MYYEWEWLSDLAIIPAWECFLAGFLVATILWAMLFFRERRRK